MFENYCSETFFRTITISTKNSSIRTPRHNEQRYKNLSQRPNGKQFHLPQKVVAQFQSINRKPFLTFPFLYGGRRCFKNFQRTEKKHPLNENTIYDNS